MKHITFDENQWNCIDKGIKIFEEIFIGVLIVGAVFFAYSWSQFDHLSFPALLQFLFITTWVGIFGLVGSIALPTFFVLLRKKLCRK